MNTPRDGILVGHTLSELATLSGDPALAFRSNPGFRAKFRNPDEITEGDFDGLQSLVPPLASTKTWAGTASWRRSPKE